MVILSQTAKFKSANIKFFAMAILGTTAKFNSLQYFRLYGIILNNYDYFCRKLRHPNIITLMAYSISENQLHIVTNYVEGPTLDKLLFEKFGDEVM